MGERDDDATDRANARRVVKAMYAKSESGQASRARYLASRKGQETVARYRAERPKIGVLTIACAECGARVLRTEAAALGRRVARRWICDEC